VTLPQVSVCVSSRNRAHLLPRLLRHLEQQTMPLDQFEVVIVDDGSTDATWAVLNAEAGTTPLRLVLHHNDSGTGPAAGRNRAWRSGTAPICAFTDDDCMPTPRWLEEVTKGLTGRHVVAAGAVRPPPEDVPRIGPYSRVVIVAPSTAWWFAAANLIVRREDLLAVGGFDETFRRPAGEDTDLGLRVMGLGAEPVFLAEALVHHSVEDTTLIQLVRDQARWGDLVNVFARHPQMRDKLLSGRYFWKPTHPYLLALLLGTALAPVAPAVSIALAAPWLHYHLLRASPEEVLSAGVVRLPGALALDLAEMAALIRGSWRYRTLVL
jgi:glycosyltransferase involved in cell wall biosynthesis